MLWWRPSAAIKSYILKSLLCISSDCLSFYFWHILIVLSCIGNVLTCRRSMRSGWCLSTLQGLSQKKTISFPFKVDCISTRWNFRRCTLVCYEWWSSFESVVNCSLTFMTYFYLINSSSFFGKLFQSLVICTETEFVKFFDTIFNSCHFFFLILDLEILCNDFHLTVCLVPSYLSIWLFSNLKSIRSHT